VSAELAEQLIAGNRRALARAISVAEAGGGAARELLAATYRHGGRAHIVGVTGPPGAGKSTLVNALTLHWRAQGATVGLVAIDPSSPFSGGAILGDRIRMQPLGGDPGVFIRSMASRGRLGGIARATGDTVALLDAAGYQIVVIETVGAGQSEVEIAGAAQTTVVVEAPGMGDEVQSIKAGILEIADIVVVNKADRPEARSTLRQLRAALQLGPMPADGWRPPVLAVVATTAEGIDRLAGAITDHLALLRAGDRIAELELERARQALRAIVEEQALEQALGREQGALWEEQARRVARREADPYSAALVLLEERG
jgi:LAO/AO transport system kinase